MYEETPRVELTLAAADLLRRLHEAHGPLMFHQSGGCCDGSAPMCYPAGEFRTAEVAGNSVDANGMMFYPHVGTVKAQSLAGGDLEDVKSLEAEAARLETLARELDSRADTLERRARELR